MVWTSGERSLAVRVLGKFGASATTESSAAGHLLRTKQADSPLGERPRKPDDRSRPVPDLRRELRVPLLPMRAVPLLGFMIALLLPPAAAAEPASTSFTISGSEYGFTSTVGSFAGSGAGNAGETGFWNATVKHDRLGGTAR